MKYHPWVVQVFYFFHIKTQIFLEKTALDPDPDPQIFQNLDPDLHEIDVDLKPCFLATKMKLSHHICKCLN